MLKKHNFALLGAMLLIVRTTIAYANSCPPPIETDLRGEMLPSQRDRVVDSLKLMADAPDGVIFSGLLNLSAFGELVLRPEYTWIRTQSQEREINGYLGASTIMIFEAYTFTGNIISNGLVSRLENASVQLNVTCITDSSTGCSTSLPIDTPITFGGLFFENPARIIINGPFCGSYLENSIFEDLIGLPDIKNNAEIWEGN